MALKRSFLTAALLAALFHGPGVRAQHALPQWVAGSHAVIDIECHRTAAKSDDAAKPDAERVASYNLLVLFLGEEQTADGPGWRLDFRIQATKPPKGISERYRVVIHKGDGWTRRILEGGRRLKEVRLPAVGIGKLPLFTPAAYPIEFVPFGADGQWSYPHPGSQVIVKRKTHEEYQLVETNFTSDSGAKVLVRQKWVQGEKWWRDYERWIDGRKDLIARASGVPPLPKKVDYPEAPRFPLRSDPALQARLTVWETDPPLANLLDRLRSATGLSLTLEPSLAAHEPTFGSVQMKGAYAWMLMELIAETQLEGGRWVKTDAGYRLEGRSSIPPPPPGLTPWQLAGLGGVGACLATLTAALTLRALRRARPTRGTSA